MHCGNTSCVLEETPYYIPKAATQLVMDNIVDAKIGERSVTGLLHIQLAIGIAKRIYRWMTISGIAIMEMTVSHGLRESRKFEKTCLFSYNLRIEHNVGYRQVPKNKCPRSHSGLILQPLLFHKPVLC